MAKLTQHDQILVTGSAGFIGFHLAKELLEQGLVIIGIDSLNDYYDPQLKKDRNKILQKFRNYKFYHGDLKNLDFVKKVLSENNISKICHLAAQAGVRHSLTHPHEYIQANIVAFTNLIDEAKNANIKDFIFASSSSVYGKNKKTPFSETDNVDNPISLYAASKKADELIAHTYHHLYGMNCTGLRFFTVYGPFGRPDMALWLFTKAISENKAIKVFNHGKMLRDFTYIDDIVSGVIASIENSYPYEIFNLGNNQPVELGYFIELIEKELGQTAQKEMLPMQAGDVVKTFADIDKAKEKLNFSPQTPLAQGVKNFVQWYRDYHEH